MAKLRAILRRSIADSGESVYRVAKDSGIDYSSLTRFVNGERDLRLFAAEKLIEYLRLELVPKDRAVRTNRRV